MRLAWRAMLCVPGDRLDRVAKAGDRGADAVVLDLEDGVASPDGKQAARGALAQTVPALIQAGRDVLVRINAPWLMAVEDIDAAIASGACALVAPKVETTARLTALVEIVDECAARHGRRPGGVELLALIESPAALPLLGDIARHPRMI